MDDAPVFTFRMESSSWKDRHLFYQEHGHELVVFLEVSGVPECDLVGMAGDFAEWTVPAGEPIPTPRQQQILDRLAEWGRAHHLRICIETPP